MGQVSALWPASAPEPLQVSQATVAGHLDLGGAAAKGFFQADLEIVAQILAAIAAPRFAAAHQVAEEILEHIGEAAGEIERPGAGARAHAGLEGGMAETVIGGALLIVLEDVIGFVDFLEIDFGGGVAGIFVGMEFHRQLAIGGLQRVDRCALLAFQGFVITALRHAPDFNRPRVNKGLSCLRA